MQMQGGMMGNLINTKFNAKAEGIVISICILVFGSLFFFPQYAENPVSKWFYDSIIGIEETFFFGFIFKVVGFFFMLTLIIKMVGSFSKMGNSNPMDNSIPEQEERSDDDFDDYEEVT